MTKEWTGKQSWTFSESHSVLSDFLRSHGLYSPWNSPGQNTGVGSCFLLQRILPIQWSNLGLPHCRRIPYQLSHKGSLPILEWVACPFSRGSSQPGIKPGSPALQVVSLPAELPGKPRQQNSFCNLVSLKKKVRMKEDNLKTFAPLQIKSYALIFKYLILETNRYLLKCDLLNLLKCV